MKSNWLAACVSISIGMSEKEAVLITMVGSNRPRQNDRVPGLGRESTQSVKYPLGDTSQYELPRNFLNSNLSPEWANIEGKRCLV